MTHRSTSSTKAHNGSAKGSSSATSSTSKAHSYKHKHNSSKDQSGEETVERFVQDDRDHRSFAVAEYDVHQVDAKKRHAEKLKDVVGKKY